MKPLLFVMRRTFVNHVKQLRYKPGILATYLIFGVFMGFALIFSYLSHPANARHSASPDVYGVIIGLVVLFFVYFTVSRGIKTGSSFFRMSDVNLVFTAPISPKRVLLYGFLKQIAATLLSVVLLVWQLPNLRNHFTISGGGVAILFGGFFLLLVLLQWAGMLIYSWTSQSHRARRLAERIWNGLGLTFAAVFVAVLLQKKDLFTAAKAVFRAKWFESLPLIGWFKVILMAPVTGVTAAFYTNVALAAAAAVVMAGLFYKLRTDYYEDVLAYTELRETMIAAKRAGRGGLQAAGASSLRSMKLRRVKQAYGGTGAAAIFYRHLLEYRKSGYLLFSRSTLFLAVLGFASRYFLHGASVTLLLLFANYYLFLMSFQGKWAQELDKPFIYLIPAGSGAKLFYATLAETLKNLADGLAFFAVAAAANAANPLTALCCALGFTSYGLVFTYSDVLVRRLFGAMHSLVFKGLLRVFLTLFVLTPSIAIGVIIKFLLFGGHGLASDLGLCFGVIAYNLVVAVGVFFGSKGIFNRLELK